MEEGITMGSTKSENDRKNSRTANDGWGLFTATEILYSKQMKLIWHLWATMLLINVTGSNGRRKYVD